MQMVPLYTAAQGYVGMAHMGANEQGEPEMAGFQPTRNLPRNLRLVISRLEDKAPKFIGFQEDNEFEAIRVFHKNYSDTVLAILYMRNKYRVEYWDPIDTANDFTVYHGPNLTEAIRCAIRKLSGYE